MGISARLGVVAIAVAVAGAALLSSETISAAMMGAEAIKARQDAMKDISKNNKVVQAFVKDGKGSAADVEKAAKAIAATAKQIPDLFPKGSGRGDFSDKETRALPKIWSDWPGFESASTVLVTESEKLAEIAAAGDKDMIATQATKMGKAGCGGCHDTYRGEKVK